MRLRPIVAATAVLLALACWGCKSSDMPPSPSGLLNGTRGRLNPFRMTMSTDPASPHAGPVTIKVHVIDEANQPADGLTVKADITMAGMDHGAQHVTLDGRGSGDYDTQVTLEMSGSWDVDFTAAKDDKSVHQRLIVDVGN